MNAKGLLNIERVAELLDVHPKTVRNMVRRGEIPKPIELNTQEEGQKRKPVRWIAQEIYDYLDQLRFTAPRKNLEKVAGTGGEQKGIEGKSAKRPQKPD